MRHEPFARLLLHQGATEIYESGVEPTVETFPSADPVAIATRRADDGSRSDYPARGGWAMDDPGILGAQGLLLLDVDDHRLEEVLSDQGRDECRQDHHAHQHRVLRLADQMVGEAVQG